MYSTTDTTEIDTVFDIEVIDLIEDMRPFWDEANGDYPGDPYDHNAFRGYYSDHHPVVFKLNIPSADDDFGNSGKLQGGVTFSGGRVGLAFHFDGVDGFVEIPHDANLDGFTQATIAAWINLDSIRGRQAILSKVPAGNYYLLVDGDRLSFENNQIAFGAFKGSTSLTSSTWYHVAATWDGIETKLYVVSRQRKWDTSAPFSHQQLPYPNTSTTRNLMRAQTLLLILIAIPWLTLKR